MMAQQVVLLFALLSVIFTSRVSAEQAAFHCTRENTQCSNHGQCNIESGFCKCSSNYHGFACQLHTSVLTVCDTACRNGGLCYQDDGAKKCLCAIGYFGPGCVVKTPSLRCDPSGMFLTTLVGGSWLSSSLIYPAPNKSPICVVRVANTGVYFIPYAGGTNCGFSRTSNEGTTTLLVSIIFQYDYRKLVRTDELYALSCTYINMKTVSSQTITVSTTSTGSLIGFGVPNTGSTALETAVNANGVAGNTANQNDIVKMTVALPSTNAVYQAIKIASCNIQVNAQSFPIITDGCVVTISQIVNNLERLDARTARISVVANNYYQSPTWAVICQVKLCQNINDCAPTNPCPAAKNWITDNGVGRKRRSDSTYIQQISFNVVVREESGSTTTTVSSTGGRTDAREGGYEDGWPMTQTQLVIVIVIVGFVFILAMIIALVFMIRRKRDKQVILLNE